MSQLILQEIDSPETPLTTKVTIYAKADGLVYSKNDAGEETLLSNRDFILLDHIGAANPHPQYLLKDSAGQMQYVTIGNVELLNKKIYLAYQPANPLYVQVDLKQGGGPLFYGEDFIVSGNEIQWTGLGYESLAELGDKLRIRYDKYNADPVLTGPEFVLIDHIGAANPHPQYLLKANSNYVQYNTVSSSNVTNKKIVLDRTPLNPQFVQVDIKEGGGSLFFGVDFIVEGNELKWEGYEYEYIVSVDDKLRIVYNAT
jgi:hypothetical protein